MRRSLTACCILCACVCSALDAQSGLWRPEDRVLISDFSSVTALARDGDVLYGVTANGIIVYDLALRAFRQPLTMEDGYPAGETPLSITYARSEFTLLIGTARGGMFSLATLSPRFDAVARLPAPVLRLVSPQSTFDTYAETVDGWFRLRSGSFRPERSAPPPPEPQAGSADPYLRSMIGTAGSVPGRQTAPVSAIETGRIPGTYVAGTLGNGLVELDTRTLERNRLTYGLNTRGARSIASWRGMIWFGGDDSALNGSLVSATRELARFTEHAPRNGAPQAAVTALLAQDSVLWVGGADGLRALEATGGRERWHDFGSVIREPVLALAHAAGSVFVGTGSGAYVIRGGLSGGAAGRSPESVLTGASVRGITAGRDSVWLASDAGLAVLPLTGSQARTVLLRGDVDPAGPVLDVAASGDTLYAITASALYRRTGTGWSAPEQLPAGVIGPLVTVRADRSGLMLTGARGAAKAHAQGAGWEYYVVPDDAGEGPVRDLLPDAGLMWLATPAGVMRITERR